MSIDPRTLGVDAQVQIARALQLRKAKKQAAPPRPVKTFESALEERYYNRELWPMLAQGIIASVDLHKTFELLPAAEYCGLRLHKAQFTPDFFVTYADGSVEVIEVKSKAVRKLQGSFVYRRRLFIDKYARPNGWAYKEFIE